MVEVEAAGPPREHEGQVDAHSRTLPLASADEREAREREKQSNEETHGGVHLFLLQAKIKFKGAVLKSQPPISNKCDP